MQPVKIKNVSWSLVESPVILMSTITTATNSSPTYGVPRRFFRRKTDGSKLIFAMPEQICEMENIAVFKVLMTASREIIVIQTVPTFPNNSEP